MNDIIDLFYKRTFKSLWMHNLNSLSEALLQNLEKIRIFILLWSPNYSNILTLKNLMTLFCDKTEGSLFQNKRIKQDAYALYKVGNTPTICYDKAFQELGNCTIFI
jgi:hypothetical protein